MRPLGPAARVLELRERGDERELAADAAVEVRERREAELFAHAVELDAAALEPLGDGAVERAPEGARGAVAGQATFPFRGSSTGRAGAC